MAQSGKLENVKQEMERMKVDVLGIAEMRYKNDGKLVSGDHTVLYSGPEEKFGKGVGFIMKNKLAASLSGYWPISDRVIAAEFNIRLFEMYVVQVYAPTSTADRDDPSILP